MEYTHHYDSPLGGITMASDGNALTGLWFDGQKYFAHTLDPDHEEKDLPIFEETDRWLDLYFAGRVPDFTPAIALKGTAFRQMVWQILFTIPYGQTMTYGEIAARIAQEQTLSRMVQEESQTYAAAQKMSRTYMASQEQGQMRMSAQAVGGAVGHNPISLIVPCHRVVGANGSLTGYAGGLDRKQKLLALEQSRNLLSKN